MCLRLILRRRLSPFAWVVDSSESPQKLCLLNLAVCCLARGQTYCVGPRYRSRVLYFGIPGRHSRLLRERFKPRVRPPSSARSATTICTYSAAYCTCCVPYPYPDHHTHALPTSYPVLPDLYPYLSHLALVLALVPYPDTSIRDVVPLALALCGKVYGDLDITTLCRLVLTFLDLFLQFQGLPTLLPPHPRHVKKVKVNTKRPRETPESKNREAPSLPNALILPPSAVPNPLGIRAHSQSGKSHLASFKNHTAGNTSQTSSTSLESKLAHRARRRRRLSPRLRLAVPSSPPSSPVPSTPIYLRIAYCGTHTHTHTRTYAYLSVRIPDTGYRHGYLLYLSTSAQPNDTHPDTPSCPTFTPTCPSSTYPVPTYRYIRCSHGIGTTAPCFHLNTEGRIAVPRPPLPVLRLLTGCLLD